MKQGRGPEWTGRHVGGQHGQRASVRVGLKEAVDALWSRTKVKRREGVRRRGLARGSDAPFLLVRRGVLATRSRRNLNALSREICWVPARLAGRPENERTTVDGPAEVGGSRSTGRPVTPAKPGGSGPGGQGKAVPVEEAASHLRLPITTAEVSQGSPRAMGVPKAIVSARQCTPAMMDEVDEVVESLDPALSKVVSNKGAPGPDGVTVGALREQWPSVSPELRGDLLEGHWRPGDVRRALVDVSSVESRVSTRPQLPHGGGQGGSAHARRIRVGGRCRSGEILRSRQSPATDGPPRAARVGDRRLLILIGRLLKAKIVLPDGVVIGVDEGVSQGSPLSPLLSNIVLDELDREPVRRGHRFARYADGCNVYVRSERAGLRVMASMERLIGWRLRLRINRDKSASPRPEDRHFLGFCLWREPQSGTAEMLLPQRTKRNAMARICDLTPRSWGGTLNSCIRQINCGCVVGTGSVGSLRPARSSRCARLMSRSVGVSA